MGWNLKRDAAEPAIVQALESVGAEVWKVSGAGLPDLLVRFKGVLYAGEVKTGKAKLRASQGAFPVWRSVDQALQAIGAVCSECGFSEPLHICRQPGFDPTIHRCLGCQP